MGIKALAAKIWASVHHRQEQSWQKTPKKNQDEILEQLIRTSEKTLFGLAHGFEDIKNYEDFRTSVPVREYEGFLPYIEKIKHGDRNILWPEKPLYLAKTSGTTAGSKYIPISREGMPFQLNAARSALLNYIYTSGKAGFTEGKMIFLQGNPELEDMGGIPTGRLSGIVAHHIPNYLQKNRLPTWKTNVIEDWETKVDQIIQETEDQNMSLISGIPPWLIMYFEKLTEKHKMPVGQLFPKLDLIITGGVNYEPYRGRMQELLGRKVQVIQTFPASEGFFAYQDRLEAEDLLLLTRHGIFYEFIALNDFGKPHAQRIPLSEVKLGVDYAMIISTNSGLWAYSIGDVVQFTSLSPHRLLVTGRTKHYTSAFGEHVISYEAEKAMKNTLDVFPNVQVNEYHLAPMVAPEEGLPYHEWLIEFSQAPENLEHFSEQLDVELRKLNVYYDDLITGKVLKRLVIRPLQKNAFHQYAAQTGKLGGQNKMPRLANNRDMAEQLLQFQLKE